jgi:hypothetical protein
MAFRTAILTIDHSTVLPLLYEYDEGEHRYRSVGYVRVGSVMVPEVEHPGRDAVSVRDQFLIKVLISVMIRRAALARSLGKPNMIRIDLHRRADSRIGLQRAKTAADGSGH